MSSTDQNAAVTVPVEETTRKTVAKRVVKPVAKTAPRAAVKRPVKVAPSAAAPTVPAARVEAPAEAKSDKLLKSKKSKRVHEDFSLPMLEYLMLETLKLRSSKLGRPVKKNVLIRAGIKALAAMSDASFLAALKTVPAVKAGRTAKD